MTPTLPATRMGRARAALTPREWRRVAGMGAAVLLLHLVGFGILFLAVVPQHYVLGSGAFGVGLGITAYTLGMRHAFDADHIAAIDNTTRTLMAEGKRPVAVGFFFSLGHSTVVFLLALLIGLGVRLLGAVQDDGSTLHTVTGLIGPSVSGVFLMLVGLINLAVLIGIVKVFRRMRTGELDEAELERHLNQRGVMNRLLGRVTTAVRSSGHMYPLGFLFGLGFDTATEIALLLATGTAVAAGMPVWAFLCLPILFAAGMSLWDSLDGTFMALAYDWAFAKPVRKIYYNVAITGLSVAIAFLVGGIEIVQILSEHLGLEGGFFRWVDSLDLNTIGYAVVGLFVLTWGIALLVWRLGRVEERWDALLAKPVAE